MPRFIIERNTGPLSEAELDAAGRRSNRVLAEMEGVTWIRSYVSHADGKIFCEYEAPNAELIREHARRAGPARRRGPGDPADDQPGHVPLTGSSGRRGRFEPRMSYQVKEAAPDGLAPEGRQAWQS